MFESGSGPSYLGLAAANNRAAHTHAANAASWAEVAKSWQIHSKKQDDEIAYLNLVIDQNNASIAGYDAYLAAFAIQHTDSPLRAASGKFFKDGKAKSKGRIIYEAAFDKLLRATGITNPAERRAD